ncbi:MAG: helix-turn-helix domain-containing protein [Lachnospiraceae bacterium]|nr:helix-turn-helix domain-containing protein [Lachnospiraceae bacterium]
MNNTYKTKTEFRYGKRIKVVEVVKKHDIDNCNINKNTVNQVIPICDKLNLTIEEAAQYSNISSKTLRRFINENAPDFILKIGTKTLIKRRIFERFLERTDTI